MTRPWITLKPITPTRSIIEWTPRAKPVRRVNDVPVFPVKMEGEA